MVIIPVLWEYLEYYPRLQVLVEMTPRLSIRLTHIQGHLSRYVTLQAYYTDLALLEHMSGLGPRWIHNLTAHVPYVRTLSSLSTLGIPLLHSYTMVHTKALSSTLVLGD